MSEAAKKNDSGMLKLTGTLGAICAVFPFCVFDRLV